MDPIWDLRRRDFLVAMFLPWGQDCEGWLGDAVLMEELFQVMLQTTAFVCVP